MWDIKAEAMEILSEIELSIIWTMWDIKVEKRLSDTEIERSIIWTMWDIKGIAVVLLLKRLKVLSEPCGI